ncbi:MAG: cysteine--tRNA ligase [Verrucomicrobia bacterium]|nr:cysteine--tRNA ligase [Verrucomicrobiota bacterium]
MALKLFNTLARSVQEFVPLDSAGKKVGMYCCGPTVYDLAHIGNFRTFVFADLVRRYLVFKGYDVRHVMNVTDVEDKIIARVREAKMPLRDFTSQYEAEFFKDLQTLNCLLPHDVPHATDYIAEMIALIEKLIARGVAYKTADGSVYFSIEKYRGCGCHYGQLVKLNFDEMRVGERVSSDEYAKESLADFALWKARVPEDGDVFWPSPWGAGRPGWHIECSAMSMKLLGPSFDLHLGGEDLMFPHHEDEIAQSEGAGVQTAGQRFVKYWLHGAHLLVEGKKMSKSLGNFFTLRDLLAKGFTGTEVRYLLLTAHYRETFNFTLEGLQGARAGLKRIYQCLDSMRQLAQFAPMQKLELAPDIVGVQAFGVTTEPDRTFIGRFESAMDNDFNVSAAWGTVFEWVREKNRDLSSGAMSEKEASSNVHSLEMVLNVFGLRTATFETTSAFIKTDEASITLDDQGTPEPAMRLMFEREAARKAKDFKRADAIRDELKRLGWVIEDTPNGARLKRL